MHHKIDLLRQTEVAEPILLIKRLEKSWVQGKDRGRCVKAVISLFLYIVGNDTGERHRTRPALAPRSMTHTRL